MDTPTREVIRQFSQESGIPATNVFAIMCAALAALRISTKLAEADEVLFNRLCKEVEDSQ